jgi:hypothetical protein
MQRGLAWVIVALLLLNTAVLGWHVTKSWSVTGAGSNPTLTDGQLAQMDKLFRVMTDFHRELETVVGQATYENDDEKGVGKRAFQDESLAYGLSKLDYQAASQSRSLRDCQEFVSGALSRRFGPGLTTAMDQPGFKRFVPAKYDNNFRKTVDSGLVSYANVSKLESLQEQFRVLAQSLVEEIK